jgi:hypothetical protein
MLTAGNIITRSHRDVESHVVILHTLVRNDRVGQAVITKNVQAIALLTGWLNATDADTDEQQETWEYLKKHLDEDRLSDRKLFPRLLFCLTPGRLG